ncbi:hypothetical protein [Pseudozobellia sp. WGM2]|uniref:hypothetical protein n=1 Tax=Pseudozobellia sp. WGM2 TaxID=2787625 RepID=UPI001AE04AE3|nr:hypothetical protein [Pseudozobellia sp. WGM2]
MASTVPSFDNNSKQHFYQDHSLKKFAVKLYRLKEKFEKKYYSIPGCRKYELARNFNIHLAATIFEVNKMLSTDGLSFSSAQTNNHQKIKTQISQLEDQLVKLIS